MTCSDARLGWIMNAIFACAIVGTLASCGTASTQHPREDARPLGTSLNAWDDDTPRKVALEQHGICRAGHDVVAWFPRDTTSGNVPLSDADMNDIVARLDRGMQAAKAFIRAPDWSCLGDQRVFFYFPDADFISHAPGGNTVYIPFWRIREDKAPWLHEAMHLLVKVDGDWLNQPEGVAEARMPLWLHEGLAEALAMEVAARVGLAHYSPLIDVPPAQLDSFAAARVRECPDPQRLLESVGGRGKLPELFGEHRMKYAAAFYAASTSFVRHLARSDRGYQRLLLAISAFDREIETYENLSGRSIDLAKQEWRLALGLDSAAPPPP